MEEMKKIKLFLHFYVRPISPNFLLGNKYNSSYWGIMFMLIGEKPIANQVLGQIGGFIAKKQ